ncbi:hypothetical protein OHB13_11945 [Streptomyces sp. NBC_00440]|uniref:hypothetical protein n=1 Tax=Streptomyces sp. NBC_00440 TaxID=2975741 RepID=UPI002E225415
MSLMALLDVDLTELGTQAAHAALLDNSADRLNALTAVFEECGKRANAYYCPDLATRDLVRWVALDFQIARRGLLGSQYI